MALDVEFDHGAARRHVRAWTRQQLPFAFATALNETVRDAQDALRSELPTHFTIRGDRTARGVRTERASKKRLVAAVGSIDDYMGLQTAGGTKAPRNGRGVAIPVKARPKKTSKTPRGKWPGALKAKGAFFVDRSSTLKGRPHPLRPRDDVVLVFMPRIGKSRKTGRVTSRKLRLMYVIKPEVEVAAAWPLEETLHDVAALVWRPNMRDAWRKALKGARRR